MTANFFIGTFKIIRPLNVFIAFASIFVAGLIASPVTPGYASIILASLVGALATSAANIINDYFDIEIDKINRPNRPLPSGQLSIKQALALYTVFTIAAVVIAYFINIPSLLLTIVFTILLFFYSYKLKGLPLLGNVVIALSTGAALILGGTAVNNWRAAVVPAVFAFMVNLIREIVKDIEDLRGDRANNIVTLPQKYGIGAAKLLVIIFTIALIIFTIQPYLTDLYSLEYLIVISIVDLIFFYFLRELNNELSPKRLRKLSLMLKVNMIIGLAAIYIGV